MASTPPREITVVRKEEKEAKLRAFILADLAARRLATPQSLPAYLMLARSLDSPVARALLALSSEAADEGLQLRVLLMMDEDRIPQTQPLEANRVSHIDVRLARDARLFDAHELLVLGPATAWIGDCMRRDPSKRDAYEFQSSDAAEAAQSATRSFERLWQTSAPVLLRCQAGDEPANSVIGAEVISATEANPIEAATRH